MDHEFQCYACARGGGWHAICTDLDIAVDGALRRAVEASLATALDMYLEWVSELPREEQARFLARRAPWHVRLEMAALTRIGHLIGAGDRYRCRRPVAGFRNFSPICPPAPSGTAAAAGPIGA